MSEKKAQVWLETVIYTLIGLVLIGVVLAVVVPNINQSKDRVVVGQSIDALSSFDDKLNEALGAGPGNTRVIDEFVIKRGNMVVDALNDTIYLIINDLAKPYSEPGVKIQVNSITILSEERQKTSRVQLLLNYSSLVNITYGADRKEVIHNFAPAPNPY